MNPRKSDLEKKKGRGVSLSAIEVARLDAERNRIKEQEGYYISRSALVAKIVREFFKEEKKQRRMPSVKYHRGHNHAHRSRTSL